MALGSVCKVRGMNQAESHRRQHLLLFASSGDFANQGGRVPFTEERHVSFGFEPFLQQRDLRAFSGAINTLDDKQLSGEPVLPVHLHRRRHLMLSAPFPLGDSTGSFIKNTLLRF